MKERILEELRRLGREEEENLFAFAAERSVSMMQAYCSREDLPKVLVWHWHSSFWMRQM